MCVYARVFTVFVMCALDKLSRETNGHAAAAMMMMMMMMT